MSDRTPGGTIRRSLDRRRLAERDIRYGVEVGPLGDRGEHEVTLEGGATQIVVTAAQSANFAPGTQVPLGSESGDQGYFIIGHPAPGKKGAAGLPLFAPGTAVYDVVGVERADPEAVSRGVAGQAVSIFGYGFRSDDRVDAVQEVAGVLVADPFATVHTPTFVSSTRVDVLVDVLASAPNPYRVSPRVRRAL